MRKELFPVAAPDTAARFRILRMPSTRKTSADPERYIAEKYTLFERIRRMKTSGRGRVEVIVELNPYVRIVSAEPLKLELTGANIFFRQAYGRYIDYAGPLRSVDSNAR